MTPPDPDYEQKTRESFNRQAVMQTIGATLESIKPGGVTIELPFNAQYTQQNDFMHAGIISTVLDSACGYAAISTLPENYGGLAVEFKINFCNPAIGDEFIAIGEVKKTGRTIIVGTGEVYAIKDGEQKLIAIMQSTMMGMENKV